MLNRMKRIAIAMTALLLLTASCDEYLKTASNNVGVISENLAESSIDEIVIFTDSAIEQETRNILNKQIGDITVNDVLSITVINIGSNWNSGDNHKLVTTLGDLKWFKNLQELTIIGQEIKNLRGIEELTNLRLLMVRDNSIKSIEQVRNLTNLVRFDCSGNYISDYTPLRNLVNLEELCGSIENISELKNLTKLRRLYSPWGLISDISELKNMQKLEYLNLHNNSISNIDSLGNLVNLYYLDLGNNKIYNIDSLSSLKKLSYLNLQDNQIADFSVLDQCPPIEEICLSGNLVSDDLLEKYYPPWMRLRLPWDEGQVEHFGQLFHPMEGRNENLGEVLKTEGADYKIENWRFYVNDSTMKNDINIAYPQIGDIDDYDLQKKINKLLYDAAFGVLIGYGQNVAGLENKVTYEIAWAGERFISIKFYISFYGYGAAYPNDLLCTANIDLRTGNQLMLKDFFEINDRFINRLKTCASLDGERYHILPELFEFLMQNYSDKELNGFLNNADIVQSGYRQAEYSSYYTENTLGISFVTSHALGSYAEIVINYDDLMDFMITDNDIWNEILPLR